MKKLSLSFASFILIFYTTCALAAGTSSLQISNKTPQVGDTFTVSVSASSSAKITVYYNNEILSLVGNSVNGTSGTDSFTFDGTACDLKFKATAPGTSGISVTSDSLSGSSVNIKVSGSATQNTQEEQGSQEVTENEPTDMVNNDGEIVEFSGSAVATTLTIMEPETLPIDALVPTDYEIEEGLLHVYALENSDSDLFFLYGAGANETPDWYILDTSNDQISRFPTELFTLISDISEPMIEEAEAPKPNLLEKITQDPRLLIAIGIFLLFLVVVIIINLILKRKYDEIEDDEDEDDTYDFDAYHKQVEKETVSQEDASGENNIYPAQGEDSSNEQDNNQQSKEEVLPATPPRDTKTSSSNDNSSDIQVIDFDDL